MRVADLLRASRLDTARNAAVLDRLSTGPDGVEEDGDDDGGGGGGGRGVDGGRSGGGSGEATALPPKPQPSYLRLSHPPPRPRDPRPIPGRPQTLDKTQAPRPPPRTSTSPLQQQGCSPSTQAAEPISKLILSALYRTLTDASTTPQHYAHVETDQSSLFLYGLVIPVLARIIAVATPGLLCIVQLPGMKPSSLMAPPTSALSNLRSASPPTADTADRDATFAPAPVCPDLERGRDCADNHACLENDPKTHKDQRRNTATWRPPARQLHQFDGNDAARYHLRHIAQQRETPSPGSTPDSTPSPKWSAPSISLSPKEEGTPACDQRDQRPSNSREMRAMDNIYRKTMREHSGTTPYHLENNTPTGRAGNGGDHEQRMLAMTKQKANARDVERNRALRLVCNGFEVLTGKLPVKENDGQQGQVTLSSVNWDKAGIVTPRQREISVVMTFSNGMVASTEGIVVSFSNGSVCHLTIGDPADVLAALALPDESPVLLFACSGDNENKFGRAMAASGNGDIATSDREETKLRANLAHLNVFVVEVGCNLTVADDQASLCQRDIRQDRPRSQESSRPKLRKLDKQADALQGTLPADHVIPVASEARFASHNRNGSSCGGSGSSSSPPESNVTRATSAGMDGSRTASCSIAERPESVENIPSLPEQPTIEECRTENQADSKACAFPTGDKGPINGGSNAEIYEGDEAACYPSELPHLLWNDVGHHRPARKRQVRPLSTTVVPNAVPLFVNTVNLATRNIVNDDSSPPCVPGGHSAEIDDIPQRSSPNPSQRFSGHKNFSVSLDPKRKSENDSRYLQAQKGGNSRFQVEASGTDSDVADTVQSMERPPAKAPIREALEAETPIGSRLDQDPHASQSTNPRTKTDTSQGCVPQSWTPMHMWPSAYPQHFPSSDSLGGYGTPVAASMHPYYYGMHRSFEEPVPADGTMCNHAGDSIKTSGQLHANPYYFGPHQSAVPYPHPHQPYIVQQSRHHRYPSDSQQHLMYQYPQSYLHPAQVQDVQTSFEAPPGYSVAQDLCQYPSCRPDFVGMHAASDRNVERKVDSGGRHHAIRESPRGHTASTRSTDSAGALEALVRMGEAPTVHMRRTDMNRLDDQTTAAITRGESGGSGQSNDGDGGSPEVDAAIPSLTRSRSKVFGTGRSRLSRRGSGAESDASGNSTGGILDSADDEPLRKRVRR